jgi:hypothetical protein
LVAEAASSIVLKPLTGLTDKEIIDEREDYLIRDLIVVSSF